MYNNAYDYGLKYELKFLNYLNKFIENEIIHNKNDQFFYCDFNIKNDVGKVILSIEIKTRNYLDNYETIFLSSSKFDKFNEYKKTNEYDKNCKFIVIWYDIQNKQFYFSEISNLLNYHNKNNTISYIPKNILQYGNKEDLQNFITDTLCY